MAITTYGRKALRRMERETGERLAWAAGPYVTTLDHRHLLWTGERWSELEQPDRWGGCGLPTALSSCSWLFGEYKEGFGRELMRGPCRHCGVGNSALHLWDCPKLDGLMGAVNPDYWPRPVHRPRWLDDPRGKIAENTRLMHLLALTLDVPIELVLAGTDGNHWSSWVTTGKRGACWRCGQPTTHVVEWPPGRVEGTNGLPVRSFACHECALHIQAYQASCDVQVVVREAA